jgi:class 3 adenylate cyclase
MIPQDSTPNGESPTEIPLNHAVRRKLTTIFCADVVGYSRLMGVDETGTLKRLKECRELVAAFIDRHRGRVVSWSGDAVLADFGSVVEAVQCAVEIQKELKARNDGKVEGERMEFRIGINLGDVMIEDHDIFGEGVNIASRLQSLATPGGILISGSVHDQVKNKLSLGFNFMGHQQVKNIAEQVPVFTVAHDGAPAMAVASGAAIVSPIGGKSGRAKAEAAYAYGSFLSRAGAGLVDGFSALVLGFLLSLALIAAFGNVIEIDDPVIPFAIEKTIETDSPSIEIAGGGREVKTTQRSIVERNFFGLATQTVRRTHVDLTVNRNANTSEPARSAADPALLKLSGTSADVLIDPASRSDLSRPSLSFVAIATYFIMLALCEGFLLRGSSPGKSLFGLRVLGSNGEAATLKQAFARNVAKLLSLATALIGFLMVLWTKRHQALHDAFADCIVVASPPKGSR